MHNIDTVQQIVEYFVMQKQQQHQQLQIIEDGDVTQVSKLLDNYLAVIASDAHLSISKFQVLAEALPGNARLCHDGLYRAIDTYLKVSTATQNFYANFNKQQFLQPTHTITVSGPPITIRARAQKAMQDNKLSEAVT